MEILAAILPYLPIVGIVIVILILLFVMIKVVSGNEVLVVTGVGATKKITKKVKVCATEKRWRRNMYPTNPKFVSQALPLLFPLFSKLANLTSAS